MKVWIQVEEEETPFIVEIEENAIVDDHRKDVFVECPDLAVSKKVGCLCKQR